MKSLVLPVFILLTGCALGSSNAENSAQISTINVSETGEQRLPTPTARDIIDGNRPYFIGPFDKLVIDVFGIEELSKREVQADATGNFSFPMAGTVQAGGKTPAEVEVVLRSRLSAAYIRDPQVTVNLKEAVSQVVTVEGQVVEPGIYPVIGKMTLLRAIAKAKGTAEFAKLDDVVIIREVDGQKYAGLYNLKQIRRGVYSDPEIFGNDVVVVGDSKARRMFKDFLQIVPLLTTPIIVALQRN